jgi:hypothetical protein
VIIFNYVKKHEFVYFVLRLRSGVKSLKYFIFKRSTQTNSKYTQAHYVKFAYVLPRLLSITLSFVHMFLIYNILFTFFLYSNSLLNSRNMHLCGEIVLYIQIY